MNPADVAGTTDAVLTVSVLFAVALALALLVERLLEVLKAVYDLIDSRLGLDRVWTRRAHRIAERLENEMRIFEYVRPETAQAVLQRFSELLLNGKGYSGRVPMLSGDLVRMLFVRGAFKLVAIGLGIALAFWVGIDLVRLWQGSEAAPTWSGLVLSGFAIGLGSGPLHTIIRGIEKARERRAKEEAGHA